MLDLSKCVAISALPQRGHESVSERLFTPVRRPFHDPLAKPHDLQSPTNDASWSTEHELALSVGQDALPGHHESTDAAGIYEREVRQIDDEGRPSYINQRISQAPGGRNVQLAMENHDVDARKATGGDAELGRHGDALPPKVAGG